uniref:Involved in de novo 2-like A n=1 Tax=Hypericum perforatum TaxID=65561 RepID=A0A4Y5U3A1_HYPPE|nr:involved in de novo 2-like A [Hypericum perforatum]
MVYKSIGDSDISDSEMEEHQEKSYAELKEGKRRVKVSDKALTCPFCPKKKKGDYQYKDLQQHAFGVGNSTSDKRTTKEKANHLALLRYLDKDLAVMAGQPKHVDKSDMASSSCHHGESSTMNGTQPESEVDGQLEEDVEMTESEMQEYAKQCYEQLKVGSHAVKNPDQTFACPYCPRKRKRDYQYKELLSHASGVGNSASEKRSTRQKATHMALTRYLENDLADKSSGSFDQNDKLVWPWTGIVVNIPTSRAQDGRFVGASGSKFRDELIRRGFNPTRVRPLWNFRGHSGTAIVEFNRDWPGFHNALSFEKAYEADHHGKKEWLDTTSEKSGIYCWVARADDYNADNIVGEHLRKIGDLKTVASLMAEEAAKQEKLISNLTNMIEIKQKHMVEMESKCSETATAMSKLMGEKERLLQAYNEEIRKIQASARDHFQKILGDHQKIKLQLESQKKELEMRGSELERREAKNEIDRKLLAEELQKNSFRNSSLELAAMEQQRADENVMKLAEEQKRQKEELHNRILQLEKKLDTKQALELEIERLKGTLNVVKHMEDEGDMQVMQKVETIIRSLRDKEEELDKLEAVNQTLVVKERMSNDELQEARKELINGLKDMAGRAHIGVKRMGELSTKPFHDAMKKMYSEEEAWEKASELCSLWEERLKEPDWHPFKVVTIDGKPKEFIDEDDERLRDVKEELGTEVCDAIVSSLTEINEYNPSGRYIISELWNLKEDRKASLKEGASYLLEHVRAALKRQKGF